MPQTAMLILDVFNDLSFPEGEQLLKQALPMLGPLKKAPGPLPPVGHSGHLLQR